MINVDLLQISNDLTILTPNRRLAATLHKIYQQQQLKHDKKVWQTPDILPIHNWFLRCYEESLITDLKPQMILSASQEAFIWEDIIKKFPTSNQLLHITKMIDAVQAAWTLVKQWKIDLHHPLFDAIVDCAAFKDWALAFQQNLAQKNWLDQASLPDKLTEKFVQQQIKLPKTILRLGFAEISPQWQQLFAILEECHVEIKEISLTEKNATNYVAEFVEADVELRAVATWAKSHAEQYENAKIACVIPALDKIRDKVLHIFSEVFSPPQQHDAALHSPIFNISAGKALTHYPVIHTALKLLALHQPLMATENLYHLMTSPFVGEAEKEYIKRGKFDHLLRRKNIHQINLLALLQETHAISLLNYCPELAKRLQEFYNLIQQQPAKQSFAKWMRIFNELLSALGWPGERVLNSEEYQVVEHWFKVLLEFASLDHVSVQIEFSSALDVLNTMVNKTIFQPQTPESRIQILGILEAAALPFDFLWVAGMDDVSWPPQARPNPFIPKKLQRDLQMPHATAERELFYCQQLIQQFKQSADTVIFSYAIMKDKLALQISPLIADISRINLTEKFKYTSFTQLSFASRQLDYLLDDVAPIIQAEKMHGGVNIIKQQALCPFKAFAEIRLYATALETTRLGLKAKERGTLIHQILEIIWAQLMDQRTLLTCDDANLNQILDAAIENALKTVNIIYHERQHYLSLEKQRLHRLIYYWFQIEKTRQPFIVSMQEKSTQLTLDKMTITIRIDRIDELADGKKLIIDYKTGKYNEIGDWFSDRPEDPQLPLYALVDPENTIGVTFAQLAAGEVGFKGVSEYALNIKGIKIIDEVKINTANSWQEQISHWKTIVNQLANDFYHGKASVDPKHGLQTCLWCQLKPFCRIYETDMQHE